MTAFDRQTAAALRVSACNTGQQPPFGALTSRKVEVFMDSMNIVRLENRTEKMNQRLAFINCSCEALLAMENGRP